MNNKYLFNQQEYEKGGINDKEQRRQIKAKGPILFGVIAGSNKLYFIGDWIDEYCDLRFDDVVKQCTDDFL